MKKNIGIVFGGVSVEHEVSIITGLQIYENIDKEKYNVSLVYIAKDGEWYSGDNLKNVKLYEDWDVNKRKAKHFFPSFNKRDGKNALGKLDAVIIACHGNYGEDGKLQGFFELLDIPYSSPGIIGSATGMDKIVMKKILSGMGLPILPYLWLTRDEWKNDKRGWINKVHYTLDYPVFIKPSNLGSSIGISMANNEEELIKGVEIASNYDKRILIEKGVENANEVNCSVLKSGGEILISEMEEPVRWEKFLSFADKYLSNSSKSGKQSMAAMTRKIPAEISEEIKDRIIDFSKKICRAVDVKGVARIDYLLNSDKTKVYVNEINTIPGSFSFYLWEPKGVDFSRLIDITIEESIKENDDKKKNIYRYDSDILKKIGGSKGAKR
jgi:D-alanine-D-alanine ligase